MRLRLGRLKTKVIILCLITSLASSCAIGVLTYFFTQEHLLKTTEQGLTNEAAVLSFSLYNSYLNIRQDLAFLYETSPINAIIQTQQNQYTNLKNKESLQIWQKRLATIFEALLKNREYYSQIRFIGLKDRGKEIVRVDVEKGKLRTVNQNELQQKGNEAYFLQAINTEKEDVFFSKITYNREHGKVTNKKTPTLRAIKPVFYKGKLFGLLVININYKKFLANAIIKAHLKRSILLYDNSKNYIEYNPVSNAINYVHNTIKEKETPKLIQAIELQKKAKGLYYSKNDISYFTKLTFEKNMRNVFLGVIVNISKSSIFSHQKTVFEHIIIYTAFISLFALCIVTIISKKLMNPLSDMASEIKNADEFSKELILPIEKNDEIGELARAFQARSAMLAQLANIDPLTRLANRNTFLKDLSDAIKSADRENCSLSLFFIDLDDFKKVNDTLGHFIGDKLLFEVAKKLENITRTDKL